MTATVDQANWSPLQELAAPTTQLAQVGSAVVPWFYTDFESEYLTLRATAGKIDLSGAGLVEVTGDDAYELLQYALARDLEFVTPEQSLISLVLDDAGRPIDIVNTYHSEGGFRLETAVGRGPETVAHLRAVAAERDYTADVGLRDDLTIILVEGPKAAKLLEVAIEPDLGSLPLSGLQEVTFAGAEVLVSRTGFTGEYGYKLIVTTADAPAVWSALDTVAPVGHQALEVAMFEVRQPVLQRELPDAAGAIEAGYSWLIDITKEEFHGRDAVLEDFEGGKRVTAIGFVLDQSGAAATDALPVGAPVTIDGQTVGSVLYSVYSPGRVAVIGLARVRPDLVAPSIGVSVGGAAGATAYAPYVIPLSWKIR